jgi:hypothetical protein
VLRFRERRLRREAMPPPPDRLVEAAFGGTQFGT